MPSPISANISLRRGHGLLRAAEIPRRTTAARITRSPVKARGEKTFVPYFTTLKFTPQISAIRSSSASVLPNFCLGGGFIGRKLAATVLLLLLSRDAHLVRRIRRWSQSFPGRKAQ